MTSLPVIKTDRLILRAFTLDDAPHVARLAGEKVIADTSQVPHPYTIEEALEWIRLHHWLFVQREELQLAVTLKESGELIGSVSLQAVFEGHQAELGYWIGREYWNCGYASESARAIMKWGFDHFRLIRIHACHLTKNPSSGRVLEKTGMKLEGISPRHFMKWGVPEDIAFWGVLREDFTE